MVRVVGFVDMPISCLGHLLPAVEILVQVNTRGTAMDLEVIPYISVDLFISLALGQDGLQSL